MTVLYNIARMTVSGTPGAGDVTLGAADSANGWISFLAAGVQNGDVIPVTFQDGTATEHSTVTYSTTGPSLTGRTLRKSTTGSLLSLTSAAKVMITPGAEDLVLQRETLPKLGGNLGSNNFNIKLEKYTADANAQNLIFQKSRNATVGSFTNVQEGDGIGSIIWQAANSGAFDNIAQIEVVARSNVGTDSPDTSSGSIMYFKGSSDEDDANNLKRLVRFDGFGGVIIGNVGDDTLPSLNFNFFGALLNVVGGEATVGLGDFRTGFGPNIAFVKGRGDVVNDYTLAVQDTNWLNLQGMWAADGSGGIINVAEMLFHVEGTPSTGIVPAQFHIKLMDTAGANTRRLIVDPAGRLIAFNIADAASRPFNFDSGLFVGADADSSFGQSIIMHGAHQTGASVLLVKTRASDDTHTAVVDGDVIGTITGTASDGDSFVDGAKISFSIDDTVSDGVVPGRINFYTQTILRMIIDSIGNITIGHDDPVNFDGASFGASPPLFGIHALGGNAAAGIGRWSNGAPGAKMLLAHSRGTTVGDFTALSADDVTGLIGFMGSDGNSFAEFASIRASVDGAIVADTGSPGRLEFFTTPVGSQTPVERLRISNDGTISIMNDATVVAWGTAFGLFNSGGMLFGVPSGGVDIGVFVTERFSILSGDRTGTNTNSAQAIFGSNEDVIQLRANTTYRFEELLVLTRSTGTTAHTLSTLFALASGFVLTSMDYHAAASQATGSTLSAISAIAGTSNTGVVLTASNTGATENIRALLTGTIRVGSQGGGFTPQFQFSATPGGAPQVKRGSFFRCWPIGDASAVKLGDIA